jgi:predicted MFS family arabinose efflux permease
MGHEGTVRRTVIAVSNRLPRSGLLALAVALALADSSIVTLALPDMVRRFDVSIKDVAWVLVSYNLVLAAVIVPAAHLVRRRPHLLCAFGSIVFALASLACGLSTDFALVVASRCVQAVGAAFVVAAALLLLRAVVGSEQHAAHVWARAGILGAALGPAVGGVLTQLAGWEAIFLAQVPMALLPLAALWRLEVRAVEMPKPRRPHVGANLALLFGSAALSAALFLLVILLVNGWALDPAVAGLVVTVMPIAAVLVGRAAPRLVNGRVARAAAGFILIAGGLAALGLLPRVGWAWTVLPQILVGAGLGLTVTALTEQALTGRTHQVVHAGWTIASRHAGIVVGLLVLTPVFAHELDRNQVEATRAGAAIVIDSSIRPSRKLAVARDVLRAIDDADGRLPDVRSAFAPSSKGEDDATELLRVGNALQNRLERAVTNAFGPPFLIAAAFALAALGVVVVTRDVEP